MKHRFMLFVASMLMLLASLQPCLAQDTPAIVWHNMDSFPVYGKITDSTSMRYSRLPASLKDKVGKDLWNLGCDSPGLYIRFRTNSRCIKAKWTHLYVMNMNHMTAICARGLDLYIHNGKQWCFAGTGRPTGSSSKESTSTMISNMDGEMKECMLYLSLYDGLKSLEIGLDEGSLLEEPVLDSPRQELSPVVMYGTSILQGGCANRPGMAYTNIISRRLDRTVINMGFSGNAHLEPEIAEYMASLPNPSMYVLDFVPNCTVAMVNERAEKFYNILREAHPDVPIVFVELLEYGNVNFDTKNAKSVPECNAALRAIYDKIRKSGDKNVWYIDNHNLIGLDYEGTVDSAHLTDLGMIRYADKVTPIMVKALKKSGYSNR